MSLIKAQHAEIGLAIDRGDAQEAFRRANQLGEQDPRDMLAYYARLFVWISQREKGIRPFIEEFVAFIDFLNRHWPNGLTPDVAPMAVRIIDQASRLAVMLLNERTIEYPQNVLAFFAEQARTAHSIATALGEREIAARAAEIVPQFWQYADPRNPTITRTLWRPDTPAVLQVEPTNQCNLKCVMCPRTTVMHRQIDYMNVETWGHVIDTWSGRERLETYDNLLTGNRFQFAIQGSVKLFFLGEFLMHPDFEAFIEVGRNRKCNVGVQTNGVLLAKRSIRRRLLAIKPQLLSISIDGFSAASYEAVRDGSRWETLKKGIEAFIAERDAAGLSKEIAVSLVSILPEGDPQAQQRIEDFLKTIADGRLTIGFIPLTSGHDTTFFAPDGHLEHQEYRPTYVVEPDRPSCAEPMNKMQVLANGQVSACCYDINGVINIGHVRDGVDAVWQSGKMRQLHLAHLRHDLTDHALCRQCLGVNADCTPAAHAGATH